MLGWKFLGTLQLVGSLQFVGRLLGSDSFVLLTRIQFDLPVVYSSLVSIVVVSRIVSVTPYVD